MLLLHRAVTISQLPASQSSRNPALVFSSELIELCSAYYCISHKAHLRDEFILIWSSETSEMY